uniref:Uncharacterized protein n=1 Tax=Opuntia streptacantha TaxID=393608 RepID=A0A7C8ZB19_OPUST
MNKSPRISFSHDLNQSDIIPIERLSSSLPDYDFDFDFCVSKRSFDQESSLADELFANGIILPIQIKNKSMPRKSVSASSSPLSASSVPRQEESNEREEKQGSSKSFWKFKRSKSFNCGSLYKKGLLWPLPLLSRSKSTGSTASDKGSMSPKDEVSHHQNHDNFNGGLTQHYQKNRSSPQHQQKPPLKKNYGSASSYNYGVLQVSPVLHVPTEKLLGLASIFSYGKDKGKKK